MVSNARRQRLSTLADVNCSRPATMLQMALGDDARRKPTQYSRPALAQATFYHSHIGMILRSHFPKAFIMKLAARRVNSNQLAVPTCSQVFPIIRDLVTRTAHTFRSENVSEHYQTVSLYEESIIYLKCPVEHTTKLYFQNLWAF